MSTLLLEPPLVSEDHFEYGERRRLDGTCGSGRTDAHGRLTLDDLVTGVWEGLAVRDAVHCLVCGGTMASSAHSHDASIGDCLNCGSRLT
jgi:hypothetical protein